MKHIDENRFESYRVEFAGFSYNVTRLGDALALWKARNDSGTLYGIEPGGNRAILDTK